MELRISSGLYRNTKLKVADETKPVRERVKLAIFSKIADKIENSECLDLYSGSGNLGLEALSRGASRVDLVEISPFAISMIKENVNHLSQNFRENFDETKINIIKKDSLDYVANEVVHYDIVFADPPYDLSSNHLLKMIDNILKRDGIFIFLHETSKKYDISAINPNLRLMDSRKYGITTVDFIASL